MGLQFCTASFCALGFCHHFITCKYEKFFYYLSGAFILYSLKIAQSYVDFPLHCL